MNKPLISVIIPVFNGERFIAEAIQSVLNQNYEPLEIIVIDDGSTDGTAEVVIILGEKIRYIFQENGGIAAARNTGLRAASGDYIAFLDADDLFCNDKLNLQLKQFDLYVSLGIALGYISRCNFTGQNTDHELADHSDKSFLLSLGSMLISKSVFHQIGNFDLEMKQAEDLDFFFRVKEAGIPIAVHPEIIQICRQHDKNITSNRKNFIFYQLLAMRKAKNRREKLCWNQPFENQEIKTMDEAINKWHTAIRKPDDGVSN